MTAVPTSSVVLPKHDVNGIKQGEAVLGQQGENSSGEEKSASNAPSALWSVIEGERWVLKGCKLWFCPSREPSSTNMGPSDSFCVHLVSRVRQDTYWSTDSSHTLSESEATARHQLKIGHLLVPCIDRGTGWSRAQLAYTASTISTASSLCLQLEAGATRFLDVLVSAALCLLLQSLDNACHILSSLTTEACPCGVS